MKILLTAFEPFGGSATNASLETIQSFVNFHNSPNFVNFLTLPVSFRRAPQLALEAIEREKPDLVICLGEAKGRAAVCLERIAVNHQHANCPDNDGYRPQHQRIMVGGPDGIFTPIDVDALASATGLTVSNTAGLYVCNTLYYTLLRRGIRTLFVHVPQPAPQAVVQILNYFNC